MTDTATNTEGFNGKTIAKIDTSAANMWVFHFTDGTKIGVEGTQVYPGVCGFEILPASDLA